MMHRPRITIAGMMWLVALLAVGLTSVRSASSFWAGAEFSITLAMLFVASLGFLVRRGEGRDFWTGFLLFGWGYFLLSFGPWFQTEVQPYLITSRAFSELYHRGFAPPTPSASRVMLQDMDLFSYSYRSYDSQVLWYRNLANFVRIGHALVTQVLAVLGGLLACRLADKTETRGAAGESTV